MINFHKTLKKYSPIIGFAALAACNSSNTTQDLSEPTSQAETTGTPVIASTSSNTGSSTSSNTGTSPDSIDSGLIHVGCNGSADPSTINASWMARKWGISIRINGGDESVPTSEVANFDVDEAMKVITSIPGVSWVQVNITNGAFGDRFTAPVEALESINPLAAPSRDLFGELATALKAEDIKVVAYIASQGPAMMKHGADKALDRDETITGLNAKGKTVACTLEPPTEADDQYTTYCSASMNRWRDHMYDLYKSPDHTLYRKFELAMANQIVEELSTRYGKLIDGWWFDHTSASDAKLLQQAALAGNPNATLTFNEGEKVPLFNTTPGLSDYTFGHPNPLVGTVTQDDANEPMIESIEIAEDGIIYGPDCEPSLGHVFFPIQENWAGNGGHIVFSEAKASEWQNRALGSGGAITWAISHQGNAGDADDPMVLATPQVKFLKRLQVNTGLTKHYKLDYVNDNGIEQTGINFPHVYVRGGRVARFNNDSDIITLEDYYGIEGTTPRSISGWFRTLDDNGTLVNWGNAKADEQWWLKVVNGKLKLNFHDSSVTGSSVVNDNQWHHFAVVAPNNTNSKVRLYIDGVPETEVATGTSFNTTLKNEVTLGGDFIGFMDDIRFYERAISKPEVEYLATPEASLDYELALNLELDSASWRDGLVDSSVYARELHYSNKDIIGNFDDSRGYVAAFNGSDHIIINDSGDTMSTTGYNGVPGEEPRTVSAWIKTTDSDGIIVQWGSVDENDGENWIVRMLDGQLRLSIKGGSVQGSTLVSDGHWHHVAIVAPNNDLHDTKLYVDGVADFTIVSGSPTLFDTNTLNTQAMDLLIGNSYEGSLSELKIYQRALTATEVKGLATSP